MSLNDQLRSQIHRIFEPREALADQRSKDLYCEREHSPIDNLRLDFQPDVPVLRPPIAFIAGHTGAGKSSMLLRLLEQQKDDFFIVYFDIEHNLDSNRATQIDLLYLLGATIFEVAEREGVEPDPEYLRKLAQSIYSLTSTKKKVARDESLDLVKLAKNLLCFGASAFGSTLGEKLAQAALEPFRVNAGATEEETRRRESDPQVQNVITCINLIVADVQTKAGQDVLVVVDGLDKLSRLDQTRLIFVESQALRGPFCRIIYTVPMLIYLSPVFAPSEEGCTSYLLPNVKIHQKTSGDRHEPGYGTLREVAAKRLRSLGLEPDEWIDADALDYLIAKSGGVMRWFIHLMRDAFKQAWILGLDKVTREAARQAVGYHTRRLTARLTTKSIAELGRIRKNKWPEEGANISELLQGLYVLAYGNDKTWFDVHPLVWEALEE